MSGSASSEHSNLERQQLIESHLPLVRALARRHAGHGEALDDLIQVGAIGLIKASDRFDPGRGVAFATFATPAIEGEIRRHLGDRTSSPRIPRALRRLSADLRARRGELAASLGRSPTVRELASALEIDERQVQLALTAEQARSSLPLGDDALEGTVFPELAESDDRMALASGMQSLDERERQIVFLRFNADMTEREIGHVLGISQTHVSRVLGGALTQLREELVSSGDGRNEGDITPDEVISPRRKRPRAPTNRADRNEISLPPGSQPNTNRADNPELVSEVALKRRSDEHRSWWSATSQALPGVEVHGSTPEEAVSRLQPAIDALSTAAVEGGREPHEPKAPAAKPKQGSGYSGRFLVRIPSTLHEQLVRAAERDNVSLNRFVTDVLSSAVAPPPTTQSTTVAGQSPSVAGQSAPVAGKPPPTAGQQPPVAGKPPPTAGQQPPVAAQPPPGGSTPGAQSVPPSQPSLPENSVPPGSRPVSDPRFARAANGSPPSTPAGPSTRYAGSTPGTRRRSRPRPRVAAGVRAASAAQRVPPPAAQRVPPPAARPLPPPVARPRSTAPRSGARLHRQASRAQQVALAANLFVIVFAGVVAIVLLVLALQHGL